MIALLLHLYISLLHQPLLTNNPLILTYIHHCLFVLSFCCRTTPEEKLNLRVGTADLLDMLLEQNKSVEYTIALGADTFMDLTTWKWRRSKDIMEILKGRFIVFRRLQHVQVLQDGKDDTSGADADAGDAVTEAELIDRIDRVSIEMKQSCPQFKDNARIFRVPSLSAISSSLVRSSRDEDQLSSSLDERVLKYIKENRMYSFHDHDDKVHF